MKPYIYIYFEEIVSEGKTKRWLCRNRKSQGILGEVSWYNPWRQYCFFAEAGCVFSTSCLYDIADFIKTQNRLSRQAAA